MSPDGIWVGRVDGEKINKVVITPPVLTVLRKILLYMPGSSVNKVQVRKRLLRNRTALKVTQSLEIIPKQNKQVKGTVQAILAKSLTFPLNEATCLKSVEFANAIRFFVSIINNYQDVARF